MWSPRSDAQPNLAMTVDATVETCLEVVDRLTGEAHQHGIAHRVDLVPGRSDGTVTDCDVLGVSGRKLQWSIALRLLPVAGGRTRVELTLTRYRRGRPRRDELPPAVVFASLLHEALSAAGCRSDGRIADNVIRLRPPVRLGAEAG